MRSGRFPEEISNTKYCGQHDGGKDHLMVNRIAAEIARNEINWKSGLCVQYRAHYVQVNRMSNEPRMKIRTLERLEVNLNPGRSSKRRYRLKEPT